MKKSTVMCVERGSFPPPLSHTFLQFKKGTVLCACKRGAHEEEASNGTTEGTRTLSVIVYKTNAPKFGFFGKCLHIPQASHLMRFLICRDITRRAAALLVRCKETHTFEYRDRSGVKWASEKEKRECANQISQLHLFDSCNF